MISKRAEGISSFIVMDILEKAKEMEAAGDHVIHLEVGEPDFAAPASAKAAVLDQLEAGETHYTHSLGRIELRRAIADFYKRKYGVNIDPEQVVVTSGTSPAMVMAFAAILDPNDEIILPNPYYCCYPNFIKMFDGIPIPVEVADKDGFKYNPAAVKAAITGQTKAILVNSPANPTGAVYSGKEMRALAALGPLILSDEIYNGLIYDGEDHTMLEFTDNAIILNGFSKLYAMTGFRLGYMIVPPSLLRTVQKLQQNFFICAGSFIQEAAVRVLSEEEAYVRLMVKTYDERRRFLLARLEKMGIAPLCAPQGAFYALANVKAYTKDSLAFAYEVLEKAKVAMSPGIEFGSNAEGYLRISYANSLENIAEGMNRLDDFLRSAKR